MAQTIVLTDAEKDIRAFLSVLESGNIKASEAMLENFSLNYANTIMKSTRFTDMKVDFRNIQSETRDDGKVTLGSMSVNEEAKRIRLSMNLGYYLNKYNFNSQNPELRKVAVYEFVKTLNHELTHTMQHLESGERFIPSASGGYTIGEKLKFAKEGRAQATDNEYFYDENYSSTLLEGDANKKAVIKTGLQFYRIFPKDKMTRKLALRIVNDVLNSPEKDEVTYDAMSFDKGAKQSREDVTRKYADEIMSVVTPEELDKIPVLKFEYNDDGTTKSFVQLMRDRSDAIESLVRNKKILPETQVELTRQYMEVYSQLFINSLKRAGMEELAEIRKSVGDDVLLETLNTVLVGKNSEAQRYISKHLDYLDVFPEVCSSLSADMEKELLNKVQKLDEARGITVEKNKVIGKDGIESEYEKYVVHSPEISYVQNVIEYIELSKDMYKDQMYGETRASRTPYVMAMDRISKERKAELNTDLFIRKVRQNNDEEIEAKEEDEIPKDRLEEAGITVCPFSKVYNYDFMVYAVNSCILNKTVEKGHEFDFVSDMKANTEMANAEKEKEKLKDKAKTGGKTVDVEYEEKRKISGIRGFFGKLFAKKEKTVSAEDLVLAEEERQKAKKTLSSHRVFKRALEEKKQKQKDMCRELREIEPSLYESENRQLIEEQMKIIESYEQMQQEKDTKNKEVVAYAK